MPWGAAIGAGISLVGDQMKDDKNGGAGTKSSSSEPWAPAQPWLLQNIVQGQGLQNQYTSQPFSPRQTAAYDNQYALNDRVRGLVPSLLGQLGEQPVGFDKNNRDARPKAWDWKSLLEGGLGQQSVLNPAVATTARPEEPASSFMQMDGSYERPLAGSIMYPGQEREQFMSGGGNAAGAGYGQFRYGQEAPKAGTKAYRDMQEYFLNGGADPGNFYSRANADVYGNAFLLGQSPGLLSQYMLGTSGNSVGGSPAADGSGGGTPGGNW